MLSIIAGFVLALTTATGVLAVVATSMILGFVIHGTFRSLDTYLLGSLPDEHRASAYAVYSGVMMIAQALGSTVVGTLIDTGYTYDAVFRGLVGGLALFVLVLFDLYLTDKLPVGTVAPEGV